MTALLLGAYAAGIVLVRFISPGDPTGLWILATFLLITWLLLRRTTLAVLPFSGLLLLCGLLNAGQQMQPADPHHISRWAGPDPCLVEARVVRIEPWPAGSVRLVAESLRIIRERNQAQATGKILLYVKDGTLQARPGQVVRWRAKLRHPFRFGNPGEFDYPLYLAARGIHVTSFLARARDLVTIVNHPQGKPAHLENLRRRLAAHIRASVSGEEEGLLQALLLGLRGHVTERQRDLLAGGGVAHLFAISGLHFGLLALLLNQLGLWLYTRSTRLMLWSPPQRILPLALLWPLLLYLLLTGSAWSTQRAFLIVVLVAILLISGRRTSPAALLTTAAFGLLIVSPLALFQPGFQLSFAGIAGILFWARPWLQKVPRQPRLLYGVVGLILTTLAATLATAPASLWHFHQFAPATLATNLVAVPLVAWGALPLGLASIAFLPLATSVSQWLMTAASHFIALAVSSVETICRLPGLGAVSIYLTPATLVVLVGLLCSAVPMPRLRHRGRYRLVLLLMTILLGLLLRAPSPDFGVIAFSVGQGDATLVTLPGGAHYLVDGGGLPGSSIDPGERLIAPALGRMGITRLAGVVLTHAHPDHTLGLPFLLQHFAVDRVYLAADVADLAEPLQQVLRTRQIPVTQLATGWTHVRHGDGTISLFAPSQAHRDLNERSVAVFAEVSRASVLLTGDLGKAGLHQLRESGLPGPVDLLKLPHHGSRHASPADYLETFRPTTCFVSAGRDNPYGFPHGQTLEACARRQLAVYRTDRDGLLRFRPVGSGWQMVAGRQPGGQSEP